MNILLFAAVLQDIDRKVINGTIEVDQVLGITKINLYHYKITLPVAGKSLLVIL